MLNAIVDALMPPTSLTVVALVLILIAGRWYRPGVAVLVLLLVLSMPLVSSALLNSLAPPPTPPGPPPEAIVILSAEGIRVKGPVDLEPGLLTLDRLRAGAALYRRTHLPILVTGGLAMPFVTTSLAEMMGRSLEDDFGVPVRWEENGSYDTWENAEYSAAILHNAGISRIYLVTHFWHMRRALIAFRHFGLEVTPAPVRPPLPLPLSPLFLVPRVSAWESSYLALHEWTGLAYYSLRR